MDDARKWWESKQEELQKSIDELLEKSEGGDKEVLTIMMEMVKRARVKED